MKRKLPLAFAVAIAFSTLASAQEFQGAQVLLKRLAELAQAPAADPLASSPAAILRKDLEAYQKAAAARPPAEAAAQWLALVDRFTALAREDRYALNERSRRSEDNFNFESVLMALPPPAAWPDLVKAIDARPKATGKTAMREVLLRLIGHTLINQPEARWNDVAELRRLLPKGPEFNSAYALQSLTEPMLTVEPDPKRILTAFEEQLATTEKGSANVQRGQALSVPDLMQLTDEATTRKYARRVLLLPAGIEANFNGRATATIARQVAMGVASQLKTPPWSLMNSLDSMELFEAMQKKFPAKSDQEPPSRRTATTYYILGLLANNRTSEAAKLVAIDDGNCGDNFSEGLDELEKNGKGRAVFAFLNELLTQKPELNDLWTEFIPLAARVGETARMLENLRTAIARENLPAATRSKLRDLLIPALLAGDQVEEAMREMQAVIDGPPPKPEADEEMTPVALYRHPSRPREDNRFSHAQHLAKIGKLMDRPEWIEAGVTAARRLADERRKAKPTDDALSDLARLFVDLGRDADAEKCLIDEVLTRGRQPYEQNQTLATLLLIYDKAGRTDDVLALLDGAPEWGVPDLIGIRGGYLPGNSSVPLAAARALVAKGRNDEARRLVDATLEEEGGYDPAYAFLIKLGGQDVIPQLDKLAAQDRFQERPLIWKARLQFEAGELDEAEKTVRAAIAIDPSDGEQPKNDRMRAYAVLADILEKKSDAAQAKIFRGAVEAIRLSENADDWWEVGLLTRAVKMYEEALTHFADAYCIQSRLALRYAELGQMDKAEMHYRRAYELMPDSFGRMESHCFGCEKAFAGFRAQSLAEKVFTSMIAKSPDKPQLHYLLGYLREQQDQPAEALESFRRAVALDPDYLNAWKKFSELTRDTRVPAADTDAAVLNVIRLDPLKRHGWPGLEAVTDLRGLWLAVEAAGKLRPSVRTSLYPLAASKAALEKPDPAKRDQDREITSSREAFPTPGKAMTENRLISTFGNMVENFAAD